MCRIERLLLRDDETFAYYFGRKGKRGNFEMFRNVLGCTRQGTWQVIESIFGGFYKGNQTSTASCTVIDASLWFNSLVSWRKMLWCAAVWVVAIFKRTFGKFLAKLRPVRCFSSRHYVLPNTDSICNEKTLSCAAFHHVTIDRKHVESFSVHFRYKRSFSLHKTMKKFKLITFPSSKPTLL